MEKEEVNPENGKLILIAMYLASAGILMIAIWTLYEREQRKRRMMKQLREETERERQASLLGPPVSEEKKKVCQLVVKLRSGQQLGWTNGDWDSVAKQFYRWYLGRPDSPHFVMRCRDKSKEPMTQILLRSEIQYVETAWVEPQDSQGTVSKGVR